LADANYAYASYSVWGGSLRIEIVYEFNQSEERNPISSLVNFVLIGQNLIQTLSQSVI